MACLLQGLKLVNPDGSLNSQVAIDKIPDTIDSRDIIVNAINVCSQRKGSEPCSTAHELFNCIHENKIPELLLG
uniref:Odorant-binding protein 11 n=1 Tax=Aulacocentrum confusum TaxID=2767324 RepID=A0A7G8Z912_9HYME|nr:odorant-binding protein 11 [Aulacocentrum confusum]